MPYDNVIAGFNLMDAVIGEKQINTQTFFHILYEETTQELD